MKGITDLVKLYFAVSMNLVAMSCCSRSTTAVPMPPVSTRPAHRNRDVTLVVEYFASITEESNGQNSVSVIQEWDRPGRTVPLLYHRYWISPIGFFSNGGEIFDHQCDVTISMSRPDRYRRHWSKPHVFIGSTGMELVKIWPVETDMFIARTSETGAMILKADFLPYYKHM